MEFTNRNGTITLHSFFTPVNLQATDVFVEKFGIFVSRTEVYLRHFCRHLNSELAQLDSSTIVKTNQYGSSQFKIRAGPAGLHLFDRLRGIHIPLDEVELNPNVWSLAPRQISIALTNVCDLSCPHCYAPKNKCTLSFVHVKNWLKELDIYGCMGVGFGGEPTLYPRLIEICSYAMRKTNLAVTMTTHGHRLSNNLIHNLAGNLHFVRVGMDGIGSTYESIRRRSFDSLIQRIKVFGSIVPFGINFVVNLHTILQLDAAVELAENFGASEFLLLPEETVGRRCGIDANTRRELMQWVQRHQGEISLTINERGADEFPAMNPLAAESGLSAYAHVDASGVLRSTSYATNGVKI